MDSDKTPQWQVVNADCFVYMKELLRDNPNGLADMIFADPPYFLSNDGVTCQSGRMVSVNKGEWDRAPGVEKMHAYNREWLGLARRLLKPNGTIWVSGTLHAIYSLGLAIQEVGFRVLNDIVWMKPNPPPNLGCRNFTHSTEIVLWASKSSASRHVFNYAEMKTQNGGKQMKNVWQFSAPGKDEKRHGRHPTQKPIRLLERIVAASTLPGQLVLDPFCGSGTTGVAAVLQGRNFIGIEQSPDYCGLSRLRIAEALK